MALVLFDSNILIDALKGYEQALQELAYWDGPAISAVTWMEVYAGATPEEVPRLDELIANVGFDVIQTSADIMKLAAQIRGDSLRKGPKIALPDAIIMATGMNYGLQIITRNKKDFKGSNVRIPYELVTKTTVEVVNVSQPGERASIEPPSSAPLFQSPSFTGVLFGGKDYEPPASGRPRLTKLK